MPSERSAGEDTRVWIGRVSSGHEADHTRFVEWLNGAEAESVFRRRRLTEYLVVDRAGTITVIFKAPHTLAPDRLSQTGRREFRHLLRGHNLELTAVGCPLRRGR